MSNVLEFVAQLFSLAQDEQGKPFKRTKKALRKVGLANLSQDTLESLAKMISNGYRLIKAESPSDWEKAYNDIHSCMHGEGLALHDSYTPIGAELLMLVDKYETVIARAIVYGDRFHKVYGLGHYILETVLGVCGYIKDDCYLDSVVDKIVRPRTYKYEGTVVLRLNVLEFGPHTRHRLLSRLKSEGWNAEWWFLDTDDVIKIDTDVAGTVSIEANFPYVDTQAFGTIKEWYDEKAIVDEDLMEPIWAEVRVAAGGAGIPISTYVRAQDEDGDWDLYEYHPSMEEYLEDRNDVVDI